MTITAEQKAEWQEAREQVATAIARLNAVYVATGRRYRAHVQTRFLKFVPDLGDDLGDDLDGLGPIDGYRPTYSPGSERAEREDETGDATEAEAEAESADEI
jgi:hypothetical protein